MRKLFLASVMLLAAMVLATAETPKAIRVIVPFAAGGSADILARLLGEQIGRAQNVRIAVENRPGAGTVTATEAVSRAVPDGTTLLVNANSFIINAHLRKLNYEPLADFEPVCQLVYSPQVFVVNSASPFHTLADLIEAARSKPGELTMASSGPASTQHIAVEELKRRANVNITFLPYPGDVPAVNALLGNHITSEFGNYSVVIEQVNAGKLRVLATGSRSRIDLLPDVPTVGELGYRDYSAEVWFGLVAPAKTPTETLDQLAIWITAALQDREIKQKLRLQGLYPTALCRSEFRTFIRKQYDEYGRIVRESDIKEN